MAAPGSSLPERGSPGVNSIVQLLDRFLRGWRKQPVEHAAALAARQELRQLRRALADERRASQLGQSQLLGRLVDAEAEVGALTERCSDLVPERDRLRAELDASLEAAQAAQAEAAAARGRAEEQDLRTLLRQQQQQGRLEDAEAEVHALGGRCSDLVAERDRLRAELEAAQAAAARSERFAAALHATKVRSLSADPKVTELAWRALQLGLMVAAAHPDLRLTVSAPVAWSGDGGSGGAVRQSQGVALHPRSGGRAADAAVEGGEGAQPPPVSATVAVAAVVWYLGARWQAAVAGIVGVCFAASGACAAAAGCLAAIGVGLLDALQQRLLWLLGCSRADFERMLQWRRREAGVMEEARRVTAGAVKAVAEAEVRERNDLRNQLEPPRYWVEVAAANEKVNREWRTRAHAQLQRPVSRRFPPPSTRDLAARAALQTSVADCKALRGRVATLEREAMNSQRGLAAQRDAVQLYERTRDDLALQVAALAESQRKQWELQGRLMESEAEMQSLELKHSGLVAERDQLRAELEAALEGAAQAAQAVQAALEEAEAEAAAAQEAEERASRQQEHLSRRAGRLLLLGPPASRQRRRRRRPSGLRLPHHQYRTQPGAAVGRGAGQGGGRSAGQEKRQSGPGGPRSRQHRPQVASPKPEPPAAVTHGSAEGSAGVARSATTLERPARAKQALVADAASGAVGAAGAAVIVRPPPARPDYEVGYDPRGDISPQLFGLCREVDELAWRLYSDETLGAITRERLCWPLQHLPLPPPPGHGSGPSSADGAVPLSPAPDPAHGDLGVRLVSHGLMAWLQEHVWRDPLRWLETHILEEDQQPQPRQRQQQQERQEFGSAQRSDVARRWNEAMVQRRDLDSIAHLAASMCPPSAGLGGGAASPAPSLAAQQPAAGARPDPVDAAVARVAAGLASWLLPETADPEHTAQDLQNLSSDVAVLSVAWWALQLGLMVAAAHSDMRLTVSTPVAWGGGGGGGGGDGCGGGGDGSRAGAQGKVKGRPAWPPAPPAAAGDREQGAQADRYAVVRVLQCAGGGTSGGIASGSGGGASDCAAAAAAAPPPPQARCVTQRIPGTRKRMRVTVADGDGDGDGGGGGGGLQAAAQAAVDPAAAPAGAQQPAARYVLCTTRPGVCLYDGLRAAWLSVELQEEIICWENEGMAPPGR
ncbi:hypothetical protein GPECTOR_23g16 [Gonium pectorale]|uniref:Uncharacterized protein n=1 Tax=Gonium pectorale TaxID=33097 RepID=A0A150GHH9_GONPE|nr:hypothetical protein GPECTOR_23g16 [Gonium pectorale]|eukprot:KXZ49075.1 hypothetical protein GPECTOR_23g16 [Gonium pectorale]